MDNQRITLMRLPLELRNEIYIYLMSDLRSSIQIPTQLHGSALRFLARRLPHCLLLSRQMLQEAAMAYLRRTVLIANSTSFVNVENLLSQFPNDLAYQSVRYLEFSRPQPCYAHIYAAKSPLAPTASVHDIVLRCPGLRHLTFTIPPDMLATTRKESKIPRARTMAEIESKMRFSRLFEHEHIREIHFYWLPAANRAGLAHDAAKLFSAFGTWLREQAEKQGKKLHVEVHIPYPKERREQYQPSLPVSSVEDYPRRTVAPVYYEISDFK